jgi:hypothetical protein
MGLAAFHEVGPDEVEVRRSIFPSSLEERFKFSALGWLSKNQFADSRVCHVSSFAVFVQQTHAVD